MMNWRRVVFGMAMVAMGALLSPTSGGSPSLAVNGDLAAFNAAFRDVILRMDSAGTVALWAEDGVSLMPEAEPISGKKSIAAFMDRVTKDFAGYKVTVEEIEWKDLRIAGDWASEWGMVHQEVTPPGEKPAIEVYGRIALILHQQSDGWKIQQEMWQSGPKP